MRRMAARVLLAALLLAGAPAAAVAPDEVLADPALEARARAISAGLRCVQCQNQTIDESNAPLARDLRLIVRERLAAGDSDAEVIAHVRARYGDFVLLKPPFNPLTALLWAGPFLALVGAVALFVWRLRRPSAEAFADAAPAGADLDGADEDGPAR